MTTFDQETVDRLQGEAHNLRRMVLDLTHQGQCGHPGGSLSSAEIMSCLYFEVLNINPKEPEWEDRDRLILSKGHAAPIYYSALAEVGYFSSDLLATYGRLDTILQGHPDMRTPGVDMSSGSLGQGLSPALGIALGAKLRGKSFRTYAVLGDGECQEGQIWEAAMVAPRFELDNLAVIVDKNRLQLTDFTSNAIPVEPLGDKWVAFNWHVIEVDGHNVAELLSALAEATETKGKPTAIIAHTTKGKGVSFMEDQAIWHAQPPSDEEHEQAVEEILLACKGDLS
jgi:transketolase